MLIRCSRPRNEVSSHVSVLDDRSAIEAVAAKIHQIHTGNRRTEFQYGISVSEPTAGPRGADGVCSPRLHPTVSTH